MFEPIKKVYLGADYKILQNLICKNCGEKWTEHQAVPTSSSGAGECPHPKAGSNKT